MLRVALQAFCNLLQLLARLSHSRTAKSSHAYFLVHIVSTIRFKLDINMLVIITNPSIEFRTWKSTIPNSVKCPKRVLNVQECKIGWNCWECQSAFQQCRLAQILKKSIYVKTHQIRLFRDNIWPNSCLLASKATLAYFLSRYISINRGETQNLGLIFPLT